MRLPSSLYITHSFALSHSVYLSPSLTHRYIHTNAHTYIGLHTYSPLSSKLPKRRYISLQMNRGLHKHLIVIANVYSHIYVAPLQERLVPTLDNETTIRQSGL